MRLADLAGGPGRPRPSVPLPVLLPLLLIIQAACTVQLASPFSEQLARDAAAFQESFIGFAADMRSKAGTPAGSVEAAEPVYNALMAKLVSMQAQSDLLAAGIDCRALVTRVRDDARRRFPGLERTLALGSGGAAETEASSPSCQTRLIELVQQQLMELRTIQAEDCAPGKPVRPCQSIWGPRYAFGLLVLDPESSDPARRTGRPVYFVLSATRALLFALENKAADRRG